MPVHRGSTAQVQGLYPWLYGGAMPPVGAYIGTDCLTGGAFSCHPVEWLIRGLVTNPNMLITGVPGAGKSATIKALMLRLMAYGVRCFVAGDIKNEYAPLARALGVEPVELGPGLRARLNPLDAGPLGSNLPAERELLRDRLDEIHRRRLTLLSTLIGMRLGRKLDPTEEAALSLALREASGEAGGASVLTDPTIPQVHALLHDPLPGMAADLRIDGGSGQRLREMIRPCVDALGNMTAASLAGLFDGPTTVRLDFESPIQTVDLSRIDKRADETVAMTLACVSSWGQAAVDEPGGPVRMIVRDELWRAMQIPMLVRKIDSDLRLSRAHGTIQLLATHRLADFEAVGAAGSEEVAVARNLIASCDVRVVLRQDTAPLAMTRDEIGLTDVECEHIASWSPAMLGRGVWKIGSARSCIVQVVLTPAERRLYWTNQALTPNVHGFAASEGSAAGDSSDTGRAASGGTSAR
jgi:type IV secretory pathway VirB4 component